MTVQIEAETRPLLKTANESRTISLQRAPSNMVVAIDVGTTKVCSIAGFKDDSGTLKVLAHSTVPCKELLRGNVSDMDVTTDSIKDSEHHLEQATGYKIASAYVGVTGSHVSFVNRRDYLDPISGHGVITAEDLDQEPKALAETCEEPGRTLVTAATIFVDKLATAVEQAGINVTGMVLEPMASGLAVMTAAERIRGSVLVDIGGSTTDVVAFDRGRICFTGVIPVGGFQFTNDIAVTYNTPYEAAEDLKLSHASTDIPRFGQEVALPITVSEVDLRVEIAEICQLIRERANELARLIKIKLDESGMENLSRYELVLTGGTSNLPGIANLFQRSLAVPVRKGMPGNNYCLPEELQDPRYATAVGILQWVGEQESSKMESPATSNETKEGDRRGLVTSLIKQISKLVPRAYFTAKKGRI